VGGVGRAGGRAAERASRQIAALQAQVRRDGDRLVDEDELIGTLETFDGLWAALSHGEQAELISAVVTSVEFHAGDGDDARVTVELRDLAPESTEVRQIA
jgi:hypothetical protein